MPRGARDATAAEVSARDVIAEIRKVIAVKKSLALSSGKERPQHEQGTRNWPPRRERLHKIKPAEQRLRWEEGIVTTVKPKDPGTSESVAKRANGASSDKSRTVR